MNIFLSYYSGKFVEYSQYSAILYLHMLIDGKVEKEEIGKKFFQAFLE